MVKRRGGEASRGGGEDGPALGADVAALVALSAAVAVGEAAAAGDAARRAVEAGATPAAVYETILQSYLFVGFPRAIEAFFAARPVLAGAGAVSDSGPDDLARWRRDGEALCRRIYGDHYPRLIETMRDLSPDLARSMILEGYGKTLSRPGLDPATREYAVVGILTVTRMWRQLRSHALGALHVGGTRAGVAAAIDCCAPFADASTLEEARRVAALAQDHAAR
jgi:4-carboxymuconolactone decarboxylase